MFADDLVVVGAGKLLAAETVEAITARQAVTVVVETPATRRARPGARRPRRHRRGHAATGSSSAAPPRPTVSQLAFEHGIRLVELSETARSLEDSLLDMTGASAEFTSA